MPKMQLKPLNRRKNLTQLVKHDIKLEESDWKSVPAAPVKHKKPMSFRRLKNRIFGAGVE